MARRIYSDEDRAAGLVSTKTSICGEWWFCEDPEDGGCWQPKIVERSRLSFRHSEWMPPRVMAEGPFCNSPEPEDWLEMRAWMDQASEQYSDICVSTYPGPDLEGEWCND